MTTQWLGVVRNLLSHFIAAIATLDDNSNNGKNEKRNQQKTNNGIF
jgi:hypothetical protein